MRISEEERLWSLWRVEWRVEWKVEWRVEWKVGGPEYVQYYNIPHHCLRGLMEYYPKDPICARDPKT